MISLILPTSQLVNRQAGCQEKGRLDTLNIRILVVDDYEPFRCFISSTLATQPRLRVISEASDGLEAVQKAHDLRPDLILLDIGLPHLNGIQAARRIRKLSPDSKILFVSMESSPDLVQAALEAGALGYVVKSAAAVELMPAVEAVLGGKRFISSRLAGQDLIHPEEDRQAQPDQVVSNFRLETSESNRHELRLYSDDAAFVDDFAHSIEADLKNGHAVLVVATESHRANLLEQLRTDGVDIDTARGRNLYLIGVPDSLSSNLNTSMNGDGLPKGVPPALVEALQAAKERHLRLRVG